MSNYNELVAILKELLTNRFYPRPDFTRGLLGDGQGNVLVPNRPDYNYVRFNRSSTETFEVFNKEVSQPVDGWPVLIGSFPWSPGLVQVVATDWSAYSQTGWGDSVASIQAHSPTHEWPNFQPGSDPLNVYLRAITPLRTQSAGTGSASVIVTSYEYDGATGTNYLWPGIPPLDLSAATPPTGSMRYMGVYLNPATNTLGVVSGSTTIYTNALEPDRPVWPRNIFPSAYVRLYGGQSMVQERDIRDARRLFDTSLPFTGSPVGLPVPIVTGSYLGSYGGTPAWGVVSQLAAPDGNPSPALSVDNSGNIGVGTPSPTTALELRRDGESATLRIQVAGTSGLTNVPAIQGAASRGTAASPAAVQNGDALMVFGGLGYGATGFPSGNRALIAFQAEETHTDSAQGTGIRFQTTAAGGTTRNEKMRLSADGNLGVGEAAPAARLDLADGAIRMEEMTAPAAPAANSAVIFVRDNGAGKTQLCVRFPTGVIQVIATEP